MEYAAWGLLPDERELNRYWLAAGLLTQEGLPRLRGEGGPGMADDRIRRNQDDLDVDEAISENEGDLAEIPEGAADEDDDFEDLDDDDDD
jgi:hypothetical protein